MRLMLSAAVLTLSLALAAPGHAQPACPVEVVVNAYEHSALAAVPAGESCAVGTLSLTISGPGGRQTLHLDRDGALERIWLADLDADGWPEVLVVTRSGGAGGDQAAALVARREGAWRARPLPALAAEHLAGYRGQDAYEIVDAQLIRSYPVYRPQDPRGQPSGGQVRFRYLPREGRWERM
jgi:hypothetical protein